MMFWQKLWKLQWFQGRAVIPAPRFLRLVFFSVLITGFGAWWGLGGLFFLLSNGILLGLVAIELLQLRKMPKFGGEREAKALFELGEENQIRLSLHASAPAVGTMWVRDDFPHGFSVNQRTFQIEWKRETEQAIVYTVWPHRRGKHFFHDLHVRMESKWKLFHYEERIPARLAVDVYPRLEPVRRVKQGFYRSMPASEGQPIARVFGRGQEFSHIREYRPDDDPRQINWMGTARRGKLVSNVYQPETGQQVAIFIDCGRLMGVQNDGESRLDRALEAALGYAAIALDRGEQVSVIAFSNRMLRMIPPGKGMAYLNKIIEGVYDLAPDDVESDYLAAWEAAAPFLKKQTLVTLFTDAANVAFADSLYRMVTLAKKRHLVLTVSMQEPKWTEILQKEPIHELDVYRQIAVEELMSERKKALTRWNHKKVIALDVEPERLASSVIYSFLDIRRRIWT
ncbi:DUF58 domain-containing protein [Thermoactinomyces daqus]|uniref:DUF58 domain-containing protein n=1 Tax=Thermoactinomyces daqus TaxID=1329516 RepID=A0A7W1XC19_9BACL|nr:DUF58 domain-containing protein [Thermoactinomyces daqus]MBA4543875.1 DUF58 domain-containing protein [Thermoactinomyces daqus]